MNPHSLNILLCLPLILQNFAIGMEHDSAAPKKADSDEYSVIWYIDKVMGIGVYDKVPQETEDAQQRIECYKPCLSISMPLLFALEKLSPDWREKDSRFVNYEADSLLETFLDLFKLQGIFLQYIDQRPEGDDEVEQFTREADQDVFNGICDKVCRRIYKKSLELGVKQLVLGSAAHKGLLYKLFYDDIGCLCGEEIVDKFVKLVGQSPTESDLEQICSTEYCKSAKIFTYYANCCEGFIVKGMIQYISIMSFLPEEKIEPNFKITNNSHLLLGSKEHNEFVKQQFNMDSEQQRRAIMNFVQHVGQKPTLEDLSRIASWHDTFLDKKFNTPKSAGCYMDYICMMSGLRREEVVPYFLKEYPHWNTQI
jgi:hypothetical protein